MLLLKLLWLLGLLPNMSFHNIYSLKLCFGLQLYQSLRSWRSRVCSQLWRSRKVHHWLMQRDPHIPVHLPLLPILCHYRGRRRLSLWCNLVPVFGQTNIACILVDKVEWYLREQESAADFTRKTFVVGSLGLQAELQNVIDLADINQVRFWIRESPEKCSKEKKYSKKVCWPHRCYENISV